MCVYTHTHIYIYTCQGMICNVWMIYGYYEGIQVVQDRTDEDRKDNFKISDARSTCLFFGSVGLGCLDLPL